MATVLKDRPAHVPAERVVDIDYFDLPGAHEDVPTAWHNLRGRYDLIWTPRYGGHWIATGAPVMETIYAQPEVFSNCEIGIPPGTMLLPMLPIQKDGADHKAYRSIIEPAFQPKVIEGYAQRARELTIELIEGFRERGSCEFIADYALILPLSIFLQMVDLPQADREQLHAHVEVTTRSSDMEKRHQAFRAIMAYLEGWIAKRREQPGDDLLSTVVHSHPFGRAATHQEILGLGGLLLFGGLDTVASMMGFVMHFLATHPTHRQWLIDNPRLVSAGIEEIMRRHAVASNTRMATRAVELDGVTVKAGDLILVPTIMYGVDDRKFEQPLEVRFDRTAQRNATFGAGPHRCPGMNLARLEMRVMVEEWLKRIPDFEVDPDREVIQRSGAVNGVLQLPLRWHLSARRVD